ncbi:hypothetical protein CH267_04585 [Rhodococcus sp. 06-621-2]|nr:hypothetical protein CH267_04585 [Rhodococcus sp. 06-621-2]
MCEVSWKNLLEDAASSRDRRETERLAAAVCIAVWAVCPESLEADRPGGFPRGRPSKQVVRDAAKLLLRTDGDDTDRNETTHVIGLIGALTYPQESLPDDGAIDELAESLDNCTRAAESALRAGDAALSVIAILSHVDALRRVGLSDEAVERAHDALDILDAAASTRQLGESLFGIAPFLPQNLGAQLRFRTHLVIHRAYMDGDRLENALREAGKARTAAEAYSEIDPANVAWAVNLAADVHRRRGDIAQFLASETELGELIELYPSSATIRRYRSACVSANAGRLRDFARAQTARYERLHTRIESDLGAGAASPTPTVAELMSAVEHYRSLGSKASLTWLGNTVYDISAGYAVAGKIDRDRATADYAASLLDVVEAAWDGFALNGRYSVILSKARLHLLRGRPCSARHVDDLLLVNTKAKRAGTRFNALRVAVLYTFPGDLGVRARLDERTADYDPETQAVGFARHAGLSAIWWTRKARTTNVKLDWRTAESESLRAVQLLRPDAVSIDLELEARLWIAAADASARLGAPDHTTLDRKVRAVRCVAELMITISTTENRQSMAERFGLLFSESLELAASLADFAAADHIMESARRDRVGLLLAELAKDERVSVEIRKLAMSLKDASEATPLGKNENTSAREQRSTRRDVAERSSAIVADRTGALRVAESVLGPLGALCNPLRLREATPSSILDGRPTATTAAVLQLMPVRSAGSVDDIDPDETQKVFRRLTIREPNGDLSEFLDSVEVPSADIGRFPDVHRVDAEWDYYDTLLLPEELRAVLDGATEPIRLIVVPTGFFHVAFESLYVNSGVNVLDRAVVSIHSSLTGALSLMELKKSGSTSPSVAVYDIGDGGLRHARVELAALQDHLDEVVPVKTLNELRSELGRTSDDAHSILAMAVHGIADEEGWGQTKVLPDGSTVSAAELLGWSVPRLCVIGSCDTPIIATGSGELGGFPLAFMLSGATTVIGGLYKINDKSTSEIMANFWDLLATELPAVVALRQAKLRWIDADPARRSRPKLWAGLITYGSPIE